MTEDEQRNRLFEQLEVRGMEMSSEEFEAVWGHLTEHSYLTDYADDPEGLLQQAVGLVRTLSETLPESVRKGPPPPRRSRARQKKVAARVAESAEKRACAFSEVAAALAQDHPDVRRFRARFLDGRLLTNEEAGEFVDSGQAERELSALAGTLVKTYRWREGDALWFVLTGEPPPIFALDARVYTAESRHAYRPNAAEITLTIKPWVAAKDVERTYRDIQRQMCGDSRSMKKRTLEAVRFVVRQIRERGAEQWPRRCERWNRQHPRWAYADFRGLRQAFERFAHPEYKLPEQEPYTPTPYQEYRSRRQRQLAEVLRKRNSAPRA